MGRRAKQRWIRPRNGLRRATKWPFAMMTAMTGAWAEMAKRNMVGPDAVRTFMEQYGKDAPLMGSSLPTPEAFKQWSEQWQKSGRQFLELANADLVPEAFRRSVAGMSSSPGFGLTREYQAKLNQAFEAWLDYLQRELAYRRLVTKAWTDSFGLMMQRMADQAVKGEGPKSAREAMEGWIKVADETFVGLFKTDEFSRAQSALMNATMRLRKQRRALMEDALKANDLPTRTEVEQAHQMIYALRKELKAVKKQLARMQSERGEGHVDGK